MELFSISEKLFFSCFFLVVKQQQQHFCLFVFFGFLFAPEGFCFAPGGRGALTHGDADLERPKTQKQNTTFEFIVELF